MKSTQSPPLPTDILVQLTAYLRSVGSSQSVPDAIATAITFWLDAQASGAHGADSPATRGYQWKTVFLPEGTVLRSWSYGEHNYARVEGDQIIHLGQAVSPNQFAQSFARSTRNAWTDLYVRRPGDKRFTLACRLRRELDGQNKQPPPAPKAAQADPIGAALNALLSQVATALKPVLVPAPAPAPLASAAPPRKVSPDPGWDLPERRKFRYRLDDVAY